MFIRLARRRLGGIQHARHEVFDFGATLHQNFAHAIVNNNIGRAMTQPLRTHLLAARLCDDLIVLINNIYPFRADKMTLFHHQGNLIQGRSYGALLD